MTNQKVVDEIDMMMIDSWIKQSQENDGSLRLKRTREVYESCDLTTEELVKIKELFVKQDKKESSFIENHFFLCDDYGWDEDDYSVREPDTDFYN